MEIIATTRLLITLVLTYNFIIEHQQGGMFKEQTTMPNRPAWESWTHTDKRRSRRHNNLLTLSVQL